MKATVLVMPKRTVLDPQGSAVRDALRAHDLPGALAVRVGKRLEIELDDTLPAAETEARLHALCRDFLSNPVIEDYELRLEE